MKHLSGRQPAEMNALRFTKGDGRRPSCPRIGRTSDGGSSLHVHADTTDVLNMVRERRPSSHEVARDKQ
jgi:hypothetical protein